MDTSVYLKNLLVLIICCVAMQLHGQVTLGIRTGYTMAWKANVTWDDEAYIHHGGFQVSLLSYFDISRTLSLGLEPGFVQRVSSFQFDPIHLESFEERILLNYFELPAMVSAKYPLWSDRWEMNVKAGYGMAILLSAFREPTSKPGEDPIETRGFGIKADHSWTFNVDHGLHGGVGIAYKIDNSSLFLETAYYMGFQQVSQFNASNNRSVHLGAGYRIVL